MTGGASAPLSPREAIALRRIAHGSLFFDAPAVSRLIALALVQQTSRGVRLTPLGQLRLNALPKSPLLARQRSIQALSGYVEGLIEKAQSQLANKTGSDESSPPSPPAPARSGTLLSAREKAKSNWGPIHEPINFVFDWEQWKSVAERRHIRMRRALAEHRQRQVTIFATSNSRIECSRRLLKATVPVIPNWLDARK